MRPIFVTTIMAISIAAVTMAMITGDSGGTVLMLGFDQKARNGYVMIGKLAVSISSAGEASRDCR